MAVTMHPAALALPALALLSSSALAQFDVGPAGSGATFDQVQAALAVAPVGATIYVLPGIYEPFDVTQGVQIIGSGSSRTSIAIPSGSSDGAIDITGVPSGQSVRISGLAIDTAAGSPDARIHVDLCAGRVELVDVVALSILWPATSFPDEAALLVTDSAGVVLDSCTLIGNRPPFLQPWQAGGKGARVVNSAVWFNRCELRGAQGNEGYGGYALDLDQSFASVARSELIGGGGGAHFGFYYWDIYGYAGAQAVELNDSELVVHGGPGNLIQGGPGTQTSSTDWTGGGLGVRVLGASLMRYASDAVIEQGIDGLGNPGTLPFLIYGTPTTGVVVTEDEARPTLAADPAAPIPGDVVTIAASGAPNALHVPLAGFAGLVPVAVGGGMHVHLDPFAAVIVDLIALDATGVGSTSINLPTTASLVGATLVMQSVDLDLSTLRLSNAAMVTVLLP